MPFTLWLPFTFVLGAIVGSFLNVCIYRLPLEKSIIWPGSRCGRCLQAIRWYDNIPLLSYWWLRGRCRVCGAKFSVRYFFVEFLTAVCVAGLFWLVVIENLYNLNPCLLTPQTFDLARLAIWAYHAILLCFLLVATFCDFDHQEIPLPLTFTGTVVGIAGSLVFAWPWPYTAEQVAAANRGGRLFLPEGSVYPWPFWYPPPDWLPAGWPTGLATGLAGLLAGTLLLRVVRFVFGLGMGAEYTEPEEPAVPEAPRAWAGGRVLSWFGRVGGRALGLGDADLMMMAGSFLGWQPVVVAFFVAVIPGLLFGVGQLILKGNRELPFGPALAVGVMATCVAWERIGPYFEQVFFDKIVFALAGVSCVLMFVVTYLLRLVRLFRQ
jgi:leader peptidase (prepilin peptidase)/N-methyltransferase